MNNFDFEIKLASKEDIPSIVDLNVKEYWEDETDWKKCSQFKRWKIGSWWADKDLLTWHYNILEESNGGIILAVSNSEVIAELDYCKSFDNTEQFKGLRIHIIWLLVDKKYRRLGIARSLINHLKGITDNPVWVEAEDHRTENLYKSIGHKIHTINNWELSRSSKPRNIGLNSMDSTYDYMLEMISQNWSMIVGRYYAPRFDILQLARSSPVFEYIWGNTEIAPVILYEINNSKALAVLTQYPRILVNQDFQVKHFEKLIGYACSRIFDIGFDRIFLQIYNRSYLKQAIQNLNFIKTSDDDNVYRIN